MPTVLITPEALVNVKGPWVSVLEEAGLTIAYPEDPTFTRGLYSAADTVRVLRPAAAVIAGGEYFTPEILAGLPKLRVVARAGVGYDRVDVPAATSRNIAVTITPTANHEGVAEQTFALIFAIAKGVVVNDARTRAGQWSSGATAPIRGKTLGLFGLGRIGRSTAIRGRAMGMTVIATEMHPDRAFARQQGIELVDFNTLLARSDYLSLHCPHNAQTDRMFNRDVFSRMKRGSVLINTARGRLVVEADLLVALKEGQLSAAGLDVFESEPAEASNPLFALKNVVVAPHLGGADKLSQDNMAIEAAQCIARLYKGDWPAGAVVNGELRAGWKPGGWE
jgi:D-3-phosphoglycerate dehydrogenase / 2-oxoglutarate reductase